MIKVAVIGIGQSLRGDDGVGLEAVRQWREKFPETASSPEVRIEASELPGLALLDLLEDVDTAILIDAIQSTTSPGTIHHLSEEELSTFAADSKNAHGWGVAETLHMGRLLDKINGIPIRLIGIEIKQTVVGREISEELREQFPAICDAIQDEVLAALTN